MAKKQTDGNLALEQQRVIVIPAHDELVARKLRVAAYARVSSSSEDQLNSYRVQNQYYSELISSNPDWEMVDIYADEGITGTSVEKREDFQRMMQDCRKGKIDSILVKSISRFARNTKDCLAAGPVVSSRNRVLTPVRYPVRWSRQSWHRWHRSRASPYLGTSNGAYRNGFRIKRLLPAKSHMAIGWLIVGYALLNQRQSLSA